MPMLKRCCFTKDLWLGSIICATWTLVWCVYLLSLSVSGLKAQYADHTVYGSEVGVLVWMTLCTSFMTFLASILLITGVFKANEKLMIPWMVLVAILLIVDPAANILYIVLYGFRPEIIAFIFIWIVISVINVYCELCVVSHYQELKAGRGRRADYVGHPRSRPAVIRQPQQTLVSPPNRHEYHVVSDEESSYNADEREGEYLEEYSQAHDECDDVVIVTGSDNSLNMQKEAVEPSQCEGRGLLIDSGVESSLSNEGSPDTFHRDNNEGSPDTLHRDNNEGSPETLQRGNNEGLPETIHRGNDEGSPDTLRRSSDDNSVNRSKEL